MKVDDGLKLRVPPHSVEAEQSVLGALLLDHTAWPEVAGAVAEGDFYRHEHRLIFAAIARLVADAAPVDAITVHERLHRAGQADDCGGLAYLTSLASSVPSAANARRYAEIVRDHAHRRTLLAAGDEIAGLAWRGADAGQALEDARDVLKRVADAAPRGRADLFRVVPMGALHEPDSTRPAWAWDGYIPAGHLTLLGGHGGTGKSTLALQLVACTGMGAECLGRATERTRVLYFSAEDPADLVLARLRRICRAMGFPPGDVEDWVQVVDASDLAPELFVERRVDGVRRGATTATYAALAEFIRSEAFGLVVIDNASDTFEGDEINRSMVRQYIRALAQLVRPHGGAVLLLAHVDKSAARGFGAAESYSGSTAWHNSARSRLVLVREKEGDGLTLRHEKCNLGPRLPELRLEWPDDGVISLPAAGGGFVARAEAESDLLAVLALIHEFTGRGEPISTGTTTKTHAHALLHREPGFPPGLRKAADTFQLLRDAHRRGFVEPQQFKGADRKPRERWALTPAGLKLIGAATAATAATSEETAAGEVPAEPCGDCGDSARGGVGGGARTRKRPHGVES